MIYSPERKRERTGKLSKDSESAGWEQKTVTIKEKQITEVDNRKQMGRRDSEVVKVPDSFQTFLLCLSDCAISLFISNSYQIHLN